MSDAKNLSVLISESFNFKGENLVMGTAIANGSPVENCLVKAPLKTFNRHGLIAGATGTGKTKTLQNIAEKLSAHGVPTLVMDIKGDLSGISQPGMLNEKISERHNIIGVEWHAKKFPVEFLSISDEPGVRLRATVSEFGPVLLSKILELNDTQAGVITILFKYSDDHHLPLLDIKDLRKLLQYIGTDEGKAEIESEYGQVSPATVSVILRKLLEVEQQGADKFFGEISFDVSDLLRKDENGFGYINILRLADLQSKPKLFSTFMLCLLAEVYATFPEKGDPEKPELCIFIDEAHLIFNEASKALLEQVSTIIKLIRSKGVGIFFITQDPTDVPDDVLGQLGMKIQHALRAFTEKDRKAIKAVAENFPPSEHYNTAELLTSLGIGEALITVLNEKGIPTPLVHTLLTAPESRMDVVSAAEMNSTISSSELVKTYNEEIDRESAFEILSKKLERHAEAKDEDEAEQESRQGRSTTSTLERMINSGAGKTILREVTRGLLGVLGIGSGTRKKRSAGWF